MNTVRSGSGAPSRSLGFNGDFYMDTSSNKIHGPKFGDLWPAGIALVGADGPPGSAGATGSPGVDGSNGANGVSG